MKTYIYKGEGECIPGLPKRVTEEELLQLADGDRDALQALIESGVYVVEQGDSESYGEPARSRRPGRKSSVAVETAAAPEGE